MVLSLLVGIRPQNLQEPGHGAPLHGLVANFYELIEHNDRNVKQPLDDDRSTRHFKMSALRSDEKAAPEIFAMHEIKIKA